MATTIMIPSQEPGGRSRHGDRIGPQVVPATRAVLNETQKSLWLLWRHRYIVLMELIIMVAFYPFLQLIIGNGSIERALVPPTLLAFLALPLLYITTLKLVGDLLEEVNSGTFAQMHLSPFSPASLLLGGVLGSVIEGVIIAVAVGVGMAWALGADIPLRVAGLLPAALTVIDIAGFALLIGGLALALPQIGAIAHLFSGLIFLLNGTFIPIELYPAWVQALARFLPITLGIEAARKLVLQGQSLGTVWGDGTLPWLIIHTVLLAALGWLVFLMIDRRAMQQGTLR
jgi:ABC-2 type transport system permease protein